MFVYPSKRNEGTWVVETESETQLLVLVVTQKEVLFYTRQFILPVNTTNSPMNRGENHSKDYRKIQRKSQKFWEKSQKIT